ncbi:hypothetical protein [Streptomyces sp. N2A]|uniref:hypothetical protein n=1 Tax=Streptomyces sp. N2A TaxID=3073936 RepID=UPI0028702EAE|nr:hypothetical protein [Streptomyces sp. N2A]
MADFDRRTFLIFSGAAVAKAAGTWATVEPGPWLDLGLPHQAAASITTGLNSLDPARTRTEAVFLTYRSRSALDAHDLDVATTYARSALDAARRTGAARCVGLAEQLLTHFKTHIRHPPVRDLLEYSAAPSQRGYA